jgi:hypothetical protein
LQNPHCIVQIADLPVLMQRIQRTLSQVGILLLLQIVLVLFPSPVLAEPVDSIVAAVNNEVITGSELNFTVALNMQFGGDKRARRTIETETLTGLITRRLLVQEARRLRFVEVTDQEISSESDKVRKRFGSDKGFADFLAAHDVTAQEFNRMLGERLLVERFVAKKVGLFTRVSREEAQAYFNEHASEFKGKRFPDAQKDILAFLTDQKVGQQLDQMVAELRDKADIRMNTAGTPGSTQ